mmetsp:Transcript_13640/g.25230  ORF Transcript_13640/g.25230 Transcript_13640/m.25230 type:complete len:238 (-) Transcript_13640:597-1310(-)
MRSGVRCADTTESSNGTPNSSKILEAACIVGRSESLPIIMPTRGCSCCCVPPRPFAASTASSSSSGSPSSAKRTRSVCISGAVTVMCPSLRPGLHAFSYQCTLVPGTVSAALRRAMVASSVSRPRMLIIAAAPTRSEVSPSGRPATQRICCSNWLVTQASIDMCPELWARGAISLKRTVFPPIQNISTANTPAPCTAWTERSATRCASARAASGRLIEGGTTVILQMLSAWRVSTTS